MSSVYATLLDQCKTTIQDLELRLGATSVAVEKRKLPTAQETLDTLPMIAIVPSERPSREEFFAVAGSTLFVLRTHPVQVVMIAASNRDPVTALDTYLDWRQEVCRAFVGGKVFTIADVSILGAKIEGGAVIDRSLYNQNYDYSGIEIGIHCVEPK